MKILKTQSLLGEGLSYFKKRKRIVCFDILDRKAYFIDPDSNWSLYSVNCRLEAAALLRQSMEEH